MLNVIIVGIDCDASTYQGGITMPQLLNVAELPSEAIITCQDGTAINLREFIEGLRTPINVLGTTSYIGQVASLGFAMTKPMTRYEDEDAGDYWDDYNSFVWFVGGWGPDRVMFFVNAVRKIRAMLREGQETLDMRLSSCSDLWFQDEVDQVNADGTFSWGDYPWGGAVKVRIGDMVLHCAISTFEDDKDDHVEALHFGGLLGKEILNHGGLSSDDD